jgi:hypothetical protein
MCAALDDLPDRSHARRARELAELGQLLVGVDTLRQHGEEQSTLGLRTVPELGFAGRHQPKYAPAGSGR